MGTAPETIEIAAIGPVLANVTQELADDLGTIRKRDACVLLSLLVAEGLTGDTSGELTKNGLL